MRVSASRSIGYLTGVLCCALAGLSAGVALAQSPSVREPLRDPGVVPDDMLTLVVGTRFVTPSDDTASPRKLFNSARIPLAAFNDTDHCVDQTALELAKEYFTNLGRLAGRAGIYYFVPDEEIEKSVSMCERLYHRPPQAWVDNKTKIIAFGQVVPTTSAPALEESLR